jgi:glycosyltransferase involved in cell wall biosynthesis
MTEHASQKKSMAPNNPLIHILWEFTDKPWGGGNQFLKALRQQFIKQDNYADTPEHADIILFNSHQFQKQALRLKLKYREKIFIHRVDGPLFHTRGEIGIGTDRKIFYCNDLVADGTVFQSEWSRNESYRQGMKKNRFETCIINAPDQDIFYPKATLTISDSQLRKIRLVTTTWSSNPRKGFDILHYLDEHLDFSRYSMIFIGNYDRPFKNITMIDPLPSGKLAEKLREQDIFIAASVGEPCSNSFLEALHCGLPAVARNNSSYPELLGKNGLLFDGKEDVIEMIDRLSENIESYNKPCNILRIDEIAYRYRIFSEQIHQKMMHKEYFPKKLSLPVYYLSRMLLKNL